MLKDKIKLDIQNVLFGADVKVFTSDDKYFNIIVVTDVFKDKSLIDRQRMIYDIVGNYIKSKQIHALSFKTYTNEEWLEEVKD